MSCLVFFDVNGTIVERDEKTDLPYKVAVNNVLGLENAMEGIDNAARSDQDVFYEILENNNIEYTEALWEEFLDEYEYQLKKFSETDIWRENVDAVEFINKLAKGDCKLMLITGELKIGAKYKLRKIGVWDYFVDGGFGEDDEKRFKIAEEALRKAKEIYKIDFDQIFVIGDTILDIQTARHINGKVISITTGANTREELAQENPDYLIDRFSDLDDVLG
jgi:phosphoglycolate phosphatase-like HAD superfamily hydrolase